MLDKELDDRQEALLAGHHQYRPLVFVLALVLLALLEPYAVDSAELLDDAGRSQQQLHLG